jgi:hypothetical protein
MDVINIFKTVLSGYYETVGINVIFEELPLGVEASQPPLRRSETLYIRKPEPQSRKIFTLDKVDIEFKSPPNISRSKSGISSKVSQQRIETKSLYTN